MQRSYDYAPSTSNDYHSHIAKIERMPSVVPTDVPRYYPSLYKVFKNKYTYGEEQQQQKPKKSTTSTTKAQQKKKVRVSDNVEILENNQDDDDDGKWDQVREESIDIVADGFINKKLRGFELCKWKTFKVG